MPQEATGKSGVPSETRNKPERPRDLLGRPLAWDAVNQLELEDHDALTVEENHDLARLYMREERFFPAHEAWETAWKQARGSGDEEFFKGLSQMGAGYTHLRRGNAHGTMVLLRRAAGRIGAYPDPHRGIATHALQERLLADAALVERGELVPSEDATVEPLDV
ncbi:MAG TPA: DUF309 domain-containing protein [Actinomycetota bacterium]|nr:DUF309 domain-containing protein [Actinomycetota bacterium]